MARRRRSGRPKMLARDRRSERAYVPLTAKERDRFIDAASRAKMPLAVWLRWLAEAETRRRAP